LFGRDRRAPNQIILDQLAVAPITAIVIAVPRPLFGALPVSFWSNRYAQGKVPWMELGEANFRPVPFDVGTDRR
jgi:hypothetical protein